jgi:hypothetical protein
MAAPLQAFAKELLVKLGTVEATTVPCAGRSSRDQPINGHLEWNEGGGDANILADDCAMIWPPFFYRIRPSFLQVENCVDRRNGSAWQESSRAARWTLLGWIGRIIIFIAVTGLFVACGLAVVLFWIDMNYPGGGASLEQKRQALFTSTPLALIGGAPIIAAASIFLAGVATFGRRLPTLAVFGTMAAILFFATKPVLKYCLAHYRLPTHLTGAANTAQERAVAKFPDLAVRNSALNREFIRRYQLYQQSNPAYFQDPEWPMHLAEESQTALQAH